MTATDVQVRIVMRERKKGRIQEQAAARANLSSRKTVAKYETLGKLPSELKQPRSYLARLLCGGLARRGRNAARCASTGSQSPLRVAV